MQRQVVIVSLISVFACLTYTNRVTGALNSLNGNKVGGTAEQGINNIALIGQLSKSKLFFADSSEEATMNWLDALEFCQMNKMQPAKIDSESENNMVAIYLNNTFSENKDFWLGAMDFGRENKYHWVTGDELTFDNWRPDEPEESLTLNCLLVDQNGTWRTMSCGATFRPLCQTLA